METCELLVCLGRRRRVDLTLEGRMRVGRNVDPPLSLRLHFQRNLNFQTWGGPKYPEGASKRKTFPTK